MVHYDLFEACELAEELVKFTIKRALTENSEELRLLKRDTEELNELSTKE